MLTGIDHVVIAVPDLDAASRDYAALGFTVVPGGRHERAVGTHNALIAFADGAYLELIAFYVPTASHRWWAPLQKGGGLVDYCLATDDLPGDAAALREAGVDVGEPEPRSRTRPDGHEVRWVFSLARGAHRGVAPFVIQDVTPRDTRVPAERTHANGVIGVDTLTVAVEDVAAVRQWYGDVLGRAGADVRRDDVQGAGVRFAVGPHTLDFVAPAVGSSPLTGWLGARGGSPYALSFKTSTPLGRVVAPARAQGARLTFD
jgi:catechol 2,3-dioxygenase-like lactoylglutathione lyase family enzyme